MPCLLLLPSCLGQGFILLPPPPLVRDSADSAGMQDEDHDHAKHASYQVQHNVSFAYIGPTDKREEEALTDRTGKADGGFLGIPTKNYHTFILSFKF